MTTASTPACGTKTAANLVYFSSVSENTRRFVHKLGFPAARIPLRPKREGMLYVTEPFVLIVPTYGGGNIKAAIPVQVRQFLNVPENRALLRGARQAYPGAVGRECRSSGERQPVPAGSDAPVGGAHGCRRHIVPGSSGAACRSGSGTS